MVFLFNTRGSDGLKVFKFDDNDVAEVRKDPLEIRVFVYSSNGVMFAYCDGKSVVVRNTAERKIVFETERPRTSKIALSPTGQVLATWEPYLVSKDQQAGTPNLCLFSVTTGELIKSFVHKKSDNWCPQWSEDEVICGRSVTSELHIYRNNDFSTMDKKLVIKDMCQFRLTKTIDIYHIAVYVPGSKGSPSFIRVFRYPNCTEAGQALCNKSFYRAEQVELLWNDPGSHLLALTSVETSEESYYGEQSVHFLAASRQGDTSLVPLSKKGPVYKVEWQPGSGKHFVVTCGFMPARVTVYNLSCESVFDFGTGPRNSTFFNPQGNILCLAGFGGLRGDLEVWDFDKKAKIAHITATDTTQFSWCPDGQHFLCATTAPRLRVNNGFALWHYTSTLVKQVVCSGPTGGTELNEVLWQPRYPLPPAPTLRYKPCPVSATPVAAPSQSVSGASAAQPVGKYVPPSMRNRPQSNLIKVRDDYVPPSNQIQDPAQPLSKAALKNKKKREARKNKSDDPKDQGDDDECHATTSSPAPQPVFQSTNDPEKDKKIRNINKKLQQITKMKEDQAAGKQLEINQIEKLKSEGDLRKELAALTL